MLSRYAAPKQEILEIIANLFIELDYSAKLCEEHPDEIVLSGDNIQRKKRRFKIAYGQYFFI